MYGKTKLTKRQIKEDKFTVFMLSARNRVLEYWQYLVIGLVAVVLIIAGVVYYFSSAGSKRQEAVDRFARALQDYRSGSGQVAIMGFNQVVEEYGSQPVAEEALFLLGKINYESRNYPEAMRYFEMYVSKYKENKLNRAAAVAGIASCLESQGQFAQAAEKFVAAYEEYPEGPLTGDYQVAAMRNFLEVGDTASARARLELIKEQFEGTGLERRAVRLFNEKSQS
jgi:TolA-binding protein